MGILNVTPDSFSDGGRYLGGDSLAVRIAELLAAGANIVNDVSALEMDADMTAVLRESGARVVLMHMQGRPRDMQTAPYYDDVVGEIYNWFREEATSDSVEDALQALGSDYDETEIRLVRLKFISEVVN